jgi:hypothetical protein
VAGLGFKDFQVGEVLTSSDVDGYLMQQTVMRFADAGARGSALGTATGTAVALAEGMVSYLDNTDNIEVYTGTAWRALGRVIQVVRATDSTNRSTTSTSYVDANVSVTMSPYSADSTLYVLLFAVGNTSSAGGSGDAEGLYQITDSGNTALSGAQELRLFHAGPAGDVIAGAPIVGVGVVASADTTSRTYKVRFRSGGGGGTETTTLRNASSTASLVVLEVA